MPRRKENDPNCEIRDSRVVCYFNEQDAAFLDELAKDIGMSRSALVVAVFERLIIGGFSIAVFIKIALQLQRRMKDHGVGEQTGFYYGIRPLPPLPDDGVTAEEIKSAVAQLKKELKPC